MFSFFFLSLFSMGLKFQFFLGQLFIKSMTLWMFVKSALYSSKRKTVLQSSAMWIIDFAGDQTKSIIWKEEKKTDIYSNIMQRKIILKKEKNGFVRMSLSQPSNIKRSSIGHYYGHQFYMTRLSPTCEHIHCRCTDRKSFIVKWLKRDGG